MPKVSVLIPTIRPQYLPQAIASVLAQTYADYEIVIGDNTADARLEPVAAAFADPRIRYLHANRGSQGGNLTFLWEQSSGPLIKFLYDDDFLLPFCLQFLADGLERKPTATFAFSQRFVVDGAGRVIEAPGTLKRDLNDTLDPHHVRETLLSRIHNFVGEPSNMMIRRSFFDGATCMTRYMGRPIRYLVDVAFYINALSLGPCVAMGARHSAFRKHAEQLSKASVNPAVATGWYEWDLLIRGEYAAGRLSAAAASEGVSKLERIYRACVGALPELQGFLDALPALQADLAQEDRGVSFDAFDAAWAVAEDVITDRRSERARGGAVVIG